MLSVWSADRSVLTPPPTPLLSPCLRRKGDFIQPDQAWGEQTGLQTAHITSKHALQLRSAFGLTLMWACVCLCLEVILSAFSMKPSLSAVHKQQRKAAQVNVDCSLLSLIHWVLLQHTSKHVNRTGKNLAVQRQPFIGHTGRGNS